VKSSRRRTAKTIAIYAIAWLLLGSAINYAQAVVYAAPAVRKRLNLQWVTMACPDDGLIVSKTLLATSAVFASELAMQNALAENSMLAERPPWLWITRNPHDTRYHTDAQTAIGWPFRSVSHSFESVPVLGKPSWTWPKAFVGSWKLSPTFILPLIPLWPGFFLNALIWGSPVLLVPAVKGLRRSRRRRRGLCPRCAYDLRTVEFVVCPECGPGVA
jgi:hypothetical protein